MLSGSADRIRFASVAPRCFDPIRTVSPTSREAASSNSSGAVADSLKAIRAGSSARAAPIRSTP